MPNKFNHTFNSLESLGCVYAKLEADEHREKQEASMRTLGLPAELVNNIDIRVALLHKNQRRRWTNTERMVAK